MSPAVGFNITCAAVNVFKPVGLVLLWFLWLMSYSISVTEFLWEKQPALGQIANNIIMLLLLSWFWKSITWFYISTLLKWDSGKQTLLVKGSMCHLAFGNVCADALEISVWVGWEVRKVGFHPCPSAPCVWGHSFPKKGDTKDPLTFGGWTQTHQVVNMPIKLRSMHQFLWQSHTSKF